MPMTESDGVHPELHAQILIVDDEVDRGGHVRSGFAESGMSAPSSMVRSRPRRNFDSEPSMSS